jgi:hypothetical protein
MEINENTLLMPGRQEVTGSNPVFSTNGYQALTELL